MNAASKARLFGVILVAGLGSAMAFAEEPVSSPPGADGVPEIAPAPVALPDPGPTLSPEQSAFRDALDAETAALDAAERDAILAFYGDRAFAPYWTEGTAAFDALTAALDTSAAQGLPARRYDADGLAALFAAPEAPVARREVAAALAFLRYGGDLGSGVLKPARIDENIDVRPAVISPAALLGKLGEANVSAVLAALAPRSPDYARLIAEKARLEQADASDAWGPEVAAGPTLHPGESGPRVAELRARLARLAYVAPNSPTAGDLFDPALSQAVESFQRDHGLNEDGAVGQHTLSEINASPRDRLRQVVVNLERLRWLNRDFGSRYILVNIPDFRATVYEAGKPVWSSKVVVGLPKTPTAEFSDVMSYLVVNPTWNVPLSISKRDLLPKLQRDPGYLARANMQIMTRSGTVIDPYLVDWNSLDGVFPFRIRQSPSDGNALGKVKFIFPNDHQIYMHDTPHRDLFARDARAFSNGCVRLADPDGLAHLLLRDQVSDPKAAFDGWVAAKAEKTVHLDHPIPVNIVYRTVFVDDAGVIRFRDDVYGRDGAVFSALEAAGVSLPLAEG